jgi:hypothetical protein
MSPMQASVPGVDVSNESPETLALAKDSSTPVCRQLPARAPAGRIGAKFIQLYHQGFDQYDNLPGTSSRKPRNLGGARRSSPIWARAS